MSKKKQNPSIVDKISSSNTIPSNNTDDGQTIESLIKQAQVSSNIYCCDSIFDTIHDSTDKIVEVASKSVAVVDRYGNELASVGTNDKVETFTNYGFSADTLNWPLWLALYNDSWVFKRAIDKPAIDEVTAGFTIKGNKNYSEIYRIYNRHKDQLCNLLKWGALFGGAIGVVLFKGIPNKDLAKPLDKKFVKGRKFKLYVTDRWYGVSPSVNDLVGNMSDIDFGKPKYYFVTLADGKQWKVHHSYILRYEHRTAPNLIKNGYLQGWGYSEGSHIVNELARDDQLKASITSLVNKSLIEVIKMAGMRGVFMGTDKGSEAQLRKRLEMVNWGRTYNSLTFLDKDDEYQQYQLTSLSGLAELLEKNMWQISAALEMQGVLFGSLKGGLSEESDAWQRYSQTIHNRSETYYRPVLQKFLSIVYIVCDITDDKGKYEIPDFEFDYLYKNERNKNKIEGIKSISDMLSKLEQDGVISKYQYAVCVKEFVNDGAIKLDFSNEILNKLKLEEEQAILDTLKSIGSKRKTPIKYNEHGEINMSSPFESSKEEYINGSDYDEGIEEEEVEQEIEPTTENTEVESSENIEVPEAPATETTQ